MPEPLTCCSRVGREPITFSPILRLTYSRLLVSDRDDCPDLAPPTVCYPPLVRRSASQMVHSNPSRAGTPLAHLMLKGLRQRCIAQRRKPVATSAKAVPRWDKEMMSSITQSKYLASGAERMRSYAGRHLIGPVLALVDCLAVLTAIALTLTLQGLVAAHISDPAATKQALMLAVIFFFTNLLRGRYQLDNHLSPKGQIGEAIWTWTIAMIALVSILFLSELSESNYRVSFLSFYVVGLPVIVLARAGLIRIVSFASRTGRITAQRIVLTGGKAEVMAFIDRHNPMQNGFSIADVALLRTGQDAAALASDLASAAARCRALRPDAVFIAAPWSDEETLDACLDAFMTLPVAIHLAPERIMGRFDGSHIHRVGSVASLRLTRPPLSMLERSAKRAFDICVASAILLLSLPLLLLIAAAIRHDSSGPVLFMQRRNGFNQQPFRIFKFRSMTVTDDGAVIRQASRNDPRITRVGAVLRRTNLDELPQLLNVIAGDMSLVGPRPHALAHDREYDRKIALYARRHNVKPGITGWAQVNGLRGETDTDEKMAKRVAFDQWYIDNWSFWLDIVILLRTVCSRKAYRNAC